MNIAEILKDSPKGTKLYSPVCGKLTLNEIKPNGIYCKTDTKLEAVFMTDGKFKSDGAWGNRGECLLFPSKEMRDWEKFQWKRGDVLESSCSRNFIIFTGWINDDYTQFYGEYYFNDAYDTFYRNQSFLCTSVYAKASDGDARKHIAAIENHYRGRLDLNTLRISADGRKTLKPFTRVLTRDDEDDEWQANIFSHSSTEYPYLFVTIRDKWKQCIPYEGNEHLLGTTDNPNE